MSTESYFDRMINVRYIIPLKIIIEAFIGVGLYTLFNRGEDLTVVYTYVGNTISYSLIACFMFTIGDYVFYIGSRIYRRLTNKSEAETQ